VDLAHDASAPLDEFPFGKVIDYGDAVTDLKGDEVVRGSEIGSSCTGAEGRRRGRR
jgi:hypothetical protein